MSSAPITRTWTQLREILNAKDPVKVSFPKLHVMGQSSTGLEVALEYPTGYVFYTVTDLSLSTVRKGTVSVTIAANSAAGFSLVTLDPVLTGATADYLIFTNPKTTQGVTSRALLTNLSTLNVRASRVMLVHAHTILVDSIAVDGATHVGPTPNPVQTDIDLDLTVGVATFDVDWMIIRA